MTLLLLFTGAAAVGPNVKGYSTASDAPADGSTASDLAADGSSASNAAADGSTASNA